MGWDNAIIQLWNLEALYIDAEFIQGIIRAKLLYNIPKYDGIKDSKFNGRYDR